MKRDIIEHIMMKIGAEPISDNSFIYRYKGRLIDTINVNGDGLMLFLLSHDCAKALFGEEEVDTELEQAGDGYGKVSIWLPAWQYHLQQMILEEDRLEYIKKFLKK